MIRAARTAAILSLIYSLMSDSAGVAVESAEVNIIDRTEEERKYFSASVASSNVARV